MRQPKLATTSSRWWFPRGYPYKSIHWVGASPCACPIKTTDNHRKFSLPSPYGVGLPQASTKKSWKRQAFSLRGAGLEFVPKNLPAWHPTSLGEFGVPGRGDACWFTLPSPFRLWHKRTPKPNIREGAAPSEVYAVRRNPHGDPGH